MTDEAAYAGGCLCGAVRYTARGAPLNVRACHCRQCRKATGGMFYARAVFPREAVERSGATTRYRSSDRLWRLSCPTCGSLVFGEPVDRPQYVGVSLATLDDVDALAPEMHIWVSSKPAWVKLDDGLPQHPEGFPW
ncbi:MAG TPA: GFA family protein [Thermoanaerobaculia bacterium]|nr:GFA family protein [Thermoanaerobaculia bacterium]